MTTDIVHAPRGGVEHHAIAAPVIEDRALRFLQSQAKQLAASSLVPKDLRGKPDDVLAVISWGHVIGISPAVAVQTIFLVEGRPYPASQAVVAAANARGHIVRPVRSTATECVVRALRRGDPPDFAVEVRYTIEDAKSAGLAGKDTYRKHAADMLFHRASRRAVKMVAPEVLLGMSELGFVMDDDPDRPAETPAVRDALETTATAALATPTSWPEAWRRRCNEIGCDRATSQQLIDYATGGATKLSVDVPEPMRPACDDILDQWARDRPENLTVWLEQPAGEP